MKKASTILIISILTLLFSSCSIKPSACQPSNKIYSIPQIKPSAFIYVDTETNVMYWFCCHESGGGLSVMLNSDGSPKLYDKKNSKYNATELSSNDLIYVDTETNVMYLYLESKSGGGLSLMLNSDGSPKLFDKKTSKYTVIEISSTNPVYVDTETSVMYLYIKRELGSGLSAMLNASGSPKLYNGESSKYTISEITPNNWFYVDKETNVMYWYSGHTGGGGFSLMLNSDGLPKIYNKTSSKYSITEITYSNTFYVDTETKVVYCYSKHISGGGLDTFVDKTGKPKLAN